MTDNTRLRLVQALYQMDMTAAPVEQLIGDNAASAFDDAPPPDEREQARFEHLLRGAVQHLDAIDEKIQACLAQGWRAERMDRTLRAILRAGLYEMLFSRLTPASSIIAGYRALAQSFFADSQASVVHGVLQAALKREGKTEREDEARP